MSRLVLQPLPALTIRASDVRDPEHLAHLLRAMYATLGERAAMVLRAVDGDERMSDARVASALRGAGNNLYFLATGHEAAGQIAMMIDTRTFAFTDGTATVGGVTPTFGAPHPLLDGAQNNDTLAGTVVLGDLIAGNATPKWARVPGQITTTRKFLRQTGTGAVSAVPAWDTLTAADVATGWQDVANVISEIVTTDKVAIGSATANGRFFVKNVGATTDALITLQAIASQSGRLIRAINSAGREQAYLDALGRLCLGSGSALDAATPAGVYFFDATNGSATAQNTIGTINWGAFAVGPPAATADVYGCQGARIYTYKDTSGQYDNGYGQDAVDAWVLVSDDSVTYSIWTILATGGTPYLRAQWAGNGDMTNYGKIRSRKTLKGAGINGVVNGVPGIELEETGTGTDAIKLRAPAVVGADRTQLLLDMNATIPVVGDKAPTVGSRQLGKVDSTALAAAVASTNLTSSAIAGMYLVSYTIADTTADAASLATVQFQVNYTDDAGATTQTGATVAVAALGRDKGTFTVHLASGELSYQTNVTGVIGATAKYSLRVRVLFLG